MKLHWTKIRITKLNSSKVNYKTTRKKKFSKVYRTVQELGIESFTGHSFGKLTKTSRNKYETQENKLKVAQFILESCVHFPELWFLHCCDACVHSMAREKKKTGKVNQLASVVLLVLTDS